MTETAWFRFTVALTNDEFSATTAAWGDVEDHLRLAVALHGFPKSSDARCEYTLGSPGTGTCTLDFFCLDSLGHVGVWATFESTYAVNNSDRYQSASVFMRCDPASIDEFIAGLRRFVAGSPNSACISGEGP